jgi:threonine dehydrogenase-like Zn-dependent dehydrogenase
MKKMRALVFRDVGRIELSEIPVPKVTQPDDVLVKVKTAGVCGSDLKILAGKLPYKPNTVLGHELCGEVVAVGTYVRHVKTGDRVAVDSNTRCGSCSFCQMGITSQCTENKNRTAGVMCDGGYAEFCLVTERQCFVLPDEIDDVVGTQVETLATVVNGMNTLLMLPYEYVLILGFGPIGYLFAQFARNIAAKVAVTEIDPFRINVAKECGLTVWNPNEVDVVEMVSDFTYGRKADIVIETTGNAFEQALKCVTPGGKVLPFGMDATVQACVAPIEITRWATKILGAYLGQNTMPAAMRILEEKRLNLKPYFTKVIPLDESMQAFDLLGLDLRTMSEHAKNAMKLVLIP